MKKLVISCQGPMCARRELLLQRTTYIQRMVNKMLIRRSLPHPRSTTYAGRREDDGQDDLANITGEKSVWIVSRGVRHGSGGPDPGSRGVFTFWGERLMASL